MPLKIPFVELLQELKTQPNTLFSIAALSSWVAWNTITHAQTSDVDNLSQKLDRHISTVQEEMNEVKMVSLENGEAINQVLILSTAETIRTQHAQICVSNDPLMRQGSQHVLDELQNRYLNMTKSYYPLDKCS